MDDAQVRMVAEGLVENGQDGPRLIGSRCAGCATLYFPQMANCPNPDCHDKRLEKSSLPARGALYSYTIQRYRPPPLFRMDDWEPYILGLVELDLSGGDDPANGGRGLRVMGMLSGIAEDRVEIGMPLRLIVEPLYRDDEQNAVCTYKFAAVDAPA